MPSVHVPLLPGLPCRNTPSPSSRLGILELVLQRYYLGPPFDFQFCSSDFGFPLRKHPLFLFTEETISQSLTRTWVLDPCRAIVVCTRLVGDRCVFYLFLRSLYKFRQLGPEVTLYLLQFETLGDDHQKSLRNRWNIKRVTAIKNFEKLERYWF